MEYKHPKFNEGYEFLEDRRILDLDKKFQEILSAEDKKEKRKLIVSLEKDWNKVRDEYLKQSEAGDNTNLKHFLRFVASMMELMDKGGMNMRRTLLGDFVDMKSKEAEPLFAKFLPSRDWRDNS